MKVLFEYIDEAFLGILTAPKFGIQYQAKVDIRNYSTNKKR